MLNGSLYGKRANPNTGRILSKRLIDFTSFYLGSFLAQQLAQKIAARAQWCQGHAAFQMLQPQHTGSVLRDPGICSPGITGKLQGTDT